MPYSLPVITEESILAALRNVIDPELHRDIVSLNMIKDLRIAGADVSLTVELTTPACPLKAQIEADVRAKLATVPGLGAVKLNMTGRVAQVISKNSLPGVKHVLAVGSGKGGVGKSTVAANIAISLARDGAAVGLMDADVYGPNIPTMFDVHAPKEVTGENKIVPAEKFGLKIISMGFFIDPSQPVIWRGPMLHSAVRQFLYDVAWGELDYLVVDLPPGTGDVQLSMAQLIPVSGAVIVATPQRVALEDAAKAVSMFRKVEVPLLGVVENMSWMACPHCNERIDPYGAGGAEKAAKEWGLRFLGAVPFDPSVRVGGDEGKPVSLGDSVISTAFREIARQAAAEISVRALSKPREISLDNLVLK